MIRCQFILSRSFIRYRKCNNSIIYRLFSNYYNIDWNTIINENDNSIDKSLSIQIDTLQDIYECSLQSLRYVSSNNNNNNNNNNNKSKQLTNGQSTLCEEDDAALLILGTLSLP